ncbi:MAG: aminoacyl-tRNA hydrolase [Armatimonadetes bacterium 55-13]|nr:aminoacyl-tRNA hydrolase [Armatimonadota bacterium]OJU61533.1 MAG: aminoacyl-tRNA hydrolase [Armatimonadetes bacterium 55-13]
MFWKKGGPELAPEWILVGLGNPGGEYKGTRHNVGFEVIDRLSESHRIKLGKAKHRAITGLGKIHDSVALLVKPLTYMNLSGQSVAPLVKEYQLKPENVFVIADDLDLPVGKLRIKLGGSAGGHNGHKSIIQHLKTQDYPRLKIGIGKVNKEATIDHVLGSFDRDEKDLIDSAIRASVHACEELVAGGLQAALRVVESHNQR